MEFEEKVKLGLGIAIIIILIGSPVGIYMHNNCHYAAQKMDDITNYDTLKKVEDTCRSYIVSYESDKVMYEQYKDSDDAEEKKWANSAKIRANKTALAYNEYILKNEFVWKDNIPDDIKEGLELID